ncbi:AraC family transcriptional regulator [Nostoc sp.]|uniref:AraC family transcriptional regulator n=1 Tax=Nostoc sp. TaxID=1180 RepID=UPI002FF74352
MSTINYLQLTGNITEQIGSCDSIASEAGKRDAVENGLTMADVALQVGFSSQSHLTQQFK